MPYASAWQKAMWVEKDKAAHPEKYKVWAARGHAKAKAKREAIRAANPRPEKAKMSDEERKAKERARDKARRNTPEHRAKERERSRRRYYSDPTRRQYMRDHQRKDRATNPSRRMKESFYRRFKDICAGWASQARILAFLGCTWHEFRLHIASKFKPGMTWDNQGIAWDFDHIMPVAWFQRTWPGDEHMMGKAFHYTNFQPLWKRDNQRKGDRIVLSYLDTETASFMRTVRDLAGDRLSHWRIIDDLEDAA